MAVVPFPPSEAAKRMMALLGGFTGAYGTYRSEEQNDAKGGKLEIRATARTVREAVTLETWEAHIRGVQSLGVIPIQEDCATRWGCIDIDKYDLDHNLVIQKLKRLKLPMIICRSKSGGGHLFLFLQKPVAASDVVVKLREIAVALGYGNSEIFPKQTQVLWEKGDFGSWLNMPYLGGDQTNRYAIKDGGMAMTLGEFLNTAENLRVTHEQLLELVKRKKDNGEIPDGPPCLQHLASVGVEDNRNNALMAFGVYARKRFPDAWEPLIDEYNQKYMKPPVGVEELQDTIKSIGRKDYNYRCGDAPIVNHCNATLCKTRRWGVGGDDDLPRITSLHKLDTDPPLWFLDIEGKRLDMSTDTLMGYSKLQKLCAERLNKVFQSIKQTSWLQILNEAMQHLVIIDAPPEVGEGGHFFELLEDFLLNRHRGRQREDMLGGRPWEDDETHRHYFRLRDLQVHLQREGMPNMTRGQITTRLRDLGGGPQFFSLKGKGMNVWWVPGEQFTEISPMDTPPRQAEPM